MTIVACVLNKQAACLGRELHGAQLEHQGVTAQQTLPIVEELKPVGD